MQKLIIIMLRSAGSAQMCVLVPCLCFGQKLMLSGECRDGVSISWQLTENFPSPGFSSRRDFLIHSFYLHALICSLPFFLGELILLIFNSHKLFSFLWHPLFYAKNPLLFILNLQHVGFIWYPLIHFIHLEVWVEETLVAVPTRWL